MKKSIKLMLFLAVTAFIAFTIPNFSNAADNTAHDEESLNSVINSADPGTTITLENDITVTKPIVIAKELTIDGNGHNVVGSNDWTSTSGNQTMFTAQFSDAKLTLKNINLKNGPKYGVQSYDGATVILDNVYITGFKYGGVLANGGKVEVKSLHLGTNGTGSNNGIEIDKGASATNNPTLVMSGTLTSDVAENVVYIAENGHLTDFTVTNSADTTNKIFIAGNKVVVTDAAENVIFESTVPDKINGNTDAQKVVITLVANDVTNKITVNKGEQITADTLKTHIKLAESQTIDGFYADSTFNATFDFTKTIDTDTTIYAKISTVQAPEPEPEPTPVPEPTPEVTTEEKDETPKTGVENYLALSVLTLVVSTALLCTLEHKKASK